MLNEINMLNEIAKEKKDVVFVTAVISLLIAVVSALGFLLTPDEWVRIKYSAPIIGSIITFVFINRQWLQYRRLGYDTWRVNRGLARMYKHK